MLQGTDGCWLDAAMRDHAWGSPRSFGTFPSLTKPWENAVSFSEFSWNFKIISEFENKMYCKSISNLCRLLVT